jgi:hypothetical protein
LVLENWWNGMWNMVFPIIPFIPWSTTSRVSERVLSSFQIRKRNSI